MSRRPGTSWQWRHPPLMWASQRRENAAAEAPPSPKRLYPVNLNPSHFRTARWWLLAEAALVLALGSVGLIAAGQQHHRGFVGALLRALALSVGHCWLLIAFGVLAALATLRRRTTLAVTTGGAIVFLLLFAIGTGSLGTAASARAALGPWGFRVGDSALCAGLTAYNFALILWLCANALEGPAWIRPTSATRQRPAHNH